MTPAAPVAQSPQNGPTGVLAPTKSAIPPLIAAPKSTSIDYSSIAKQYGGTSQPAPVGFVQNLVRGLASVPMEAGASIASGFKSLAGIGNTIIGNKAAAAQDQQDINDINSKGLNYGSYLGSAQPIGSPTDAQGNPVSFGKRLASTIGSGLEAGSYLIGGGEAGDAAIAAKDALTAGAEDAGAQTVKQALIKGAKVGAAAGALQGGGSALQSPTATAGSVIGGTALGGLAGGVLGAGIDAIGPAIGAAKSKASDVISALSPEGRAAKAATNAENLVGTIAQGSKDDIPAVTNALKQVDMTGVKTYADAADRVNEHLSNVATGLDTALETNPYQKVTSELGHTTKVGGQDVTHNYVNDAMGQLRNFYEKTNNVEGAAAIDQLAKKGATEGLTVKDVNDLARTHGKDLNGYNANGELASGLTKQAAENTRQGLKATARGEFNHPIYEQSDKVMSDLIKTKGLFQDMADKAQSAQQKIKQASLPQKVGAMLEKALNIGTLGTSRGALKAAGEALGIKGGESMTTLELQKALQGNISKLNDILGTDSKNQILDKIQSFLSDNEGESPKPTAKSPLPKPSKQGGFAKPAAIGTAAAGLGALGIAGSIPNKQTVINTPTAQSTPSLSPQINPADRQQLAATVFGELSNNKATQADEARKIINTVVNRTKQSGQSIKSVISAPNQYQAYGGPQYRQAMSGTLDAPSQAKMAVVQSVLDDLYSGKLKDNTNGSVFYQYDKNGNLVLKPGPLKKK